MNQQLTAKMNQAFEAHQALILNVGDKVFAPMTNGQFVIAYVHSFNSEFVTFQYGRFQWLMTVEEASEATFLVERFNRAAIIEEIKALWLGKAA